MNFSNALGFVGIGLTMWLLPLLAPGWFPPNAVDGSSTRALWSEFMGLLQFGMGMAFLIRDTALPAVRRVMAAGGAALRRGAIATGEWQGDTGPKQVLAVDFAGARPAAAASARPSRAAIHREHVAPWQARTLASEHRLAQLTSRWYALLREYGAGPHPLASAMFRHHPQSSFLHLVGPNLLAFEHGDATAPERQMLALLRDAGDGKPQNQPA